MSIYSDFFDLSNPCPSSIKNCEQLREEYVQDLQKLATSNNCGGCQEINLKAEYQTKIWKAYMQSLIIRA